MDKKIILIVEDDNELREALKTILEAGCGYKVFDASNGKNAIALLSAKKPHIDAAILDMVMVGHGGTVRDYLKENPQYEQIPIIFHTGLTKEQFDNKILEGAHYVHKEFGKQTGSIAKIIELLKEFLD